MEINIKELAPNPYAAVIAMIEGLKAGYLKVRMSLYLDMNEEGECFGCAATNALLHLLPNRQEIITKIAVTPDLTAISCLQHNAAIDVQPLCRFEYAIDKLRCSRPSTLFKFYDEPEFTTGILPPLSTGNWQEDLPAYEKYAEQLATEFPHWKTETEALDWYE